jgi:hypothetical protein
MTLTGSVFFLLLVVPPLAEERRVLKIVVDEKHLWDERGSYFLVTYRTGTGSAEGRGPGYATDARMNDTKRAALDNFAVNSFVVYECADIDNKYNELKNWSFAKWRFTYPLYTYFLGCGPYFFWCNNPWPSPFCKTPVRRLRKPREAALRRTQILS